MMHVGLCGSLGQNIDVLSDEVWRKRMTEDIFFEHLYIMTYPKKTEVAYI